MVLGRGELNQVYRIERIDDVVLLLKKIQKLEIGRIIDEELLVHGNWVGLSVGKLTEVWLAYLLSEGDHRLNRLEGWAKGRKYMLQSFYPDGDLDSSSFTDEKITCLLEVKVAKTLKDNGKKLKGLTSGNPSRKTPNPTAKMLLNRFKGLSFTIVFQDDVPISLALTPLGSTQKEILELMGMPTDLYEQQLIILNSFFNEQFKRT